MLGSQRDRRRASGHVGFERAQLLTDGGAVDLPPRAIVTDGHELVSFDIWDTLLVRDRPADTAKVATARRMALAARAGDLSPEHLDSQTLESYLWTHDLPPVDLVVRTSGEQRISNFLLWQMAYAELCFSDVLWPDFRAEAFLRCLAQFQQRERRFGLTSAQVKREDSQRAKA